MIKLLKITLMFFLYWILISCDSNDSYWDDNYCIDQVFNNKIQFGRYYSDKNILINYNEKSYWDLLYYPYASIDSSQYSIYELSLQEDSSFSYLKVWYQKSANGIIIDTTMMLNGNFKIIKDIGLPWHILELNADYIYEKEVKDSLNGVLNFTTFREHKFKGFEDIFFTSMQYEERINVDKYKYNYVTDNCFTLHRKSNCMSDNTNYPCSYKYEDCYWEIFRTKIFCLQQPEEIQSNSTGDSL